ncbi:MAG: ribosome recycling factor [Chitinispirillia bacterium]|jgi:ribosome recycling factor
MSIEEKIHSETNERMKKSVENLKKEFSRIRTGRASASLLDGITVDYYGSPMPVNQVATITIPEARMIIVQPWEKNMLGPIEKSIQTADIGLNPQNNGNLLRVPIPALTEERRKELVKNSKKISEEAKIAIRNIRRDSNDKLKKAEKEKEITQDVQKRQLDEIQKLTDKFIKIVDEQLVIKEKEIMEI